VLAQQRQIYSYEAIELATFYCGGVWLLMCLVGAWWGNGSVDPEVSTLLGIWGPWVILIFALLLQTVLKLMGGAAPSMRAIPKILRRSPMATLMLDHRFLTYDMGRLIPFLRQTMGEPEWPEPSAEPVEEPGIKATLWMPLIIVVLYVSMLISYYLL
ncbi:MAG: hypothetical protein LBE24_06000, partial [Methylobacillus sp.]|jgi:hypothetical protein|nr:hypothetical protein [Methylobacillus sp.]